MGIELLGPLRVDGADVSLQRRDQVVLSALAVHAGDVLSSDQLAAASWGEAPPASWPKQIHGSVLRLRRTLGAGTIETMTAGYRLAVCADDLDSHRFEGLVARGTSLASNGEFDRAAVAFERALELWRGSPYELLDGWSPGRVEAARLDEIRRSAEESVLDARLATGEHREVVAVAEARVAEEPLREHRWAILATALYRCGRQANALRTLRLARRTLVEQLGIAPGSELVGLEQAILRQDESLLSGPVQPTISQHCPYKGLAPYEVDDANTFFGRDSEVAACVNRLRTTPLLVVTGPSGCGKSSLVRAGLVPALMRAGHTVAVFVPGLDPEAAMTAALASCGAAGGVIVVDQFEEVFTFDDPPTRAAGFCARLADYATTTAPVVVTVRADHVATLGADARFARLAETGIHIVAALTGDELRAAIEGPATEAGLRVEPGLVDLLVRDCEGEPGSMPLLSHALAETWQRRDGRVLTVEGYRATGGIRVAVARSADRLYESLPADQRPTLRAMLLRLVSPSTDGEPVRSRVATKTLGGDPDRDRMLTLLVRARLVTTAEDSVELAHEALARAWPRLRSWLDDDAAGQRTLRHLSMAADGWESLGRPIGELYGGSRLDAALEWRGATSPDLTDVEAAFLDASAAEAVSERERLAIRARHQARQNRRLRRSLIGVAMLLVASLAGGLLAYQQFQTARREERAAALIALTSNAAALRTSRRDLAALLAIEAHRLAPSAATRSALFGTFTAAPGLERIVHTDFESAWLITSVALIPDSTTMVVVNGHGGLELFDTVTGDHRALAAVADSKGWAGWMTLAGGGQFAAAAWSPGYSESAGGPGLLSAWDLDTGQFRFDPIPIPDGTTRVAINHDGSRIAASDPTTGTTRIYDGARGDVIAEVERLVPSPDNTSAYEAPVVFVPNGDLLVGSAAGPLRIVNAADGLETRRIDAPPHTSNYGIWPTADGQSAVTIGTDGGPGALGWNGTVTLVTFNLRDGSHTDPVQVDAECNVVTFVERLDMMLCGTWDGRVLAYDRSTGAELGPRFDSQQGPVCGIAPDAEGVRLYLLTSCVEGDAKIIEWRLDGGGPISRLVVDTRYPSYPIRFGVGGAAGSLAVAFAEQPHEEPVTHLIALPTGDVNDRFPGIYGLLPTNDPNVVVTLFADDGSIGRYDIIRHEPIGPRVHPGFEVTGFWPDGDNVIVKGGDQEQRITAIDLATGRIAEPTIDAGEDYTFSGVIVPTGDALYTVIFDFTNAEHRIQRRDPNTGDVLAESRPGVRNIAASAGTVIASTITGRIVEVDPVTLEPIGLPFPGTNGSASDLALDSDGATLMVRGDDETLRFYDVATRTQLGDAINLNTFFLDSAALLAPDGLTAAAVTNQGIVTWDLDPEHWRSAACQLAGRSLTQAEWDQYIGDLAPYRATCPALSTA